MNSVGPIRAAETCLKYNNYLQMCTNTYIIVLGYIGKIVNELL